MGCETEKVLERFNQGIIQPIQPSLCGTQLYWVMIVLFCFTSISLFIFSWNIRIPKGFTLLSSVHLFSWLQFLSTTDVSCINVTLPIFFMSFTNKLQMLECDPHIKPECSYASLPFFFFFTKKSSVLTRIFTALSFQATQFGNFKVVSFHPHS